MHPALENAQGSVSSLFKVEVFGDGLKYFSYTRPPRQIYHKKKSVDADIKELLRVMRNALQFVQDASSLNNILFRAQDIVKKLLNTIHESSQFIRGYLEMSSIGSKSLTTPLFTHSKGH